MMRDILSTLAFLTIATSCHPAIGQDTVSSTVAENEYVLTDADKAYAGHYYLSGIMETGSELLLKNDGRYQWYLSVGSMDMTSKGIWSLQNGKIVLLADPPSNAPLLSLGNVGEWGADQERVAREDAINAANIIVLTKCKFLSYDDDIPIIDSALSPSYRDVTPDLIAKAKIADADELRLRQEYEVAAKNAIVAETNQAKTHEIARSARHAWRIAWNHRRQTESDAKLPFQRVAEPKLPAECDLNLSANDAGLDDKADWKDGFAVQLRDPKTGTTFNRVPIKFLYSDGSHISQKSRGEGIAWVKNRDDQKIIGISVDMSALTNVPPQTFTIDAVSQGLIQININGQYGAQPAFEVMQLSVEGRELIAYEGRGRYQRAE